MPHASHRLDVMLVPDDPDLDPATGGVDRLWSELARREFIRGAGEAGPAAGAFMVGGFVRLRWDRPGRRVLYANHQGGFRVRCPVTGDGLARTFNRAREAWRGQDHWSLDCPACGAAHEFGELAIEPPVAAARFALVIADAGSPAPTPEGLALVEGYLGRVHIVWRRVG